MAPTIDSMLPEELLDHVVSYCREDGVTDRKSLMSLCLASKTFNRIATRYLYSKIFLKESDHLPALAYRVFTSPTHAALVRMFVVPETWGQESEDPSTHTPRSWPQDGSPELSNMLRAKCAQFASTDNEASEMYEKIASGANEDAILALVLASLPNLHRLNINFGMFEEHADFRRMLVIITNAIRKSGSQENEGSGDHIAAKKEGSEIAGFSKPLDVMVTGTDDKYPNPTEPVATMVHLPNLRSLYAWKAGDGDDDPGQGSDIFLSLKSKSCPVEYIELRDSKLHMTHFNHLLRATIPGKLRTFSYEVGCTWAWCKVHHSKMMASLRLHHDTLEGLGLSHEDFYPYQFSDYTEENDDLPYPCSFVPFTALKRLKVAPVYVWGHHNFTSEEKLKDPRVKEMLWEALPENLEELWITRAEQQETDSHEIAMGFVPDCLLPALQLVIQKKPEAFPKLSTLRIELPLLKWKGEWFESLELVCQNATANDIQCTIVLTDMIDHFSRYNIERSWGWDEDIEWDAPNFSHNQECVKLWLKASEYNDMGQMLKDILARFEEEKQNLESSEIPYDSLKRSDLREVAQWLEQRTKTDTFWKMCIGEVTVYSSFPIFKELAACVCLSEDEAALGLFHSLETDIVLRWISELYRY